MEIYKEANCDYCEFAWRSSPRDVHGKPVSPLLSHAIPNWLCLGGKAHSGLVGYGAFENHVDFKGIIAF